MVSSSAERSTRGQCVIPELPEVETVARELRPWLTGRTVIGAERVDAPPGPKYAGLERLPGQRIEAVTRRGKFLVMPLRRLELLEGTAASAPADELIVHLGMTGVVRATPPPGHLRVHLHLSGPEPRDLYFQDVRRFGRFMVVGVGDYAGLPTLAAMGPDALDPDFTPESLRRALAISGAPIKTLLLSQRPVAGVGNIYADEALWLARVHPERPARRLTRSQVSALHAAITDVLARSLLLQGTTLNDYRTVNGEVGAFAAHLAVYGRAGEPCPRCGAAVVRTVVGQRATYACSRCQTRPRSTSRSAPRRPGRGRPRLAPRAK